MTIPFQESIQIFLSVDYKKGSRTAPGPSHRLIYETNHLQPSTKTEIHGYHQVVRQDFK